MGYRIGIDIGGTFTDFCLIEEGTGRIQVLKTPSIPERPEQAILNGLTQLLDERAFAPDEISYFIHGTTLAVNTIIQRSGAATALLVTRGFRDILRIARQRIPDLFNFFTEMPAPLVPRALVFEIEERTAASGEIVTPLNEDAVARSVRAATEQGVDSIAICFLHSYRNGSNEKRAQAIVEQVAPELYTSASYHIWPQMREYERALVTVMNAYVGKKMRRYWTGLEGGIQGLGIDARILSTKSNGGVTNIREATERPVETLLSGPASGVIGAAGVGRAAGIANLITFDMGGTSADVAVIEGEARHSTESMVGDFPIIMPAVDVTSIGAGGGSIVWTDRSGVLKVGPRSAGAKPGPACYGLGGEDATVTDAYVCLGIIDPKQFLGGVVAIDPSLAERAVARIGQVLGLSTHETAESILKVATSQMYAALVPLLARKGVSYEDFALLAFGGAGPTHGFLLAREVGIGRVLVPLHPGILCAAGSMWADFKRDFVRTLHKRLRAGSGVEIMAEVRADLEELTREGRSWLDEQGVPFVSSRVDWTADMRFLGQSFELTIALGPDVLDDLTGTALCRAFHAHYARIYGFTDETADLEILDVRATAVGDTPKPRLETLARESPGQPAPERERKVFLDGRNWKARVLKRDALASGTSFDGPAIVEQYDTTVFVPPGFHVTTDRFGNLIAELDRAR
jgi:N-methylhydantoinase A